MSVKLTLEAAPHPQRELSREYVGGQLVIGRGDECDWTIDDPDMFVSRRHCVITDETGEICALDASSGGLYVDGRSEALGSGNSAKLEHEMRLRMGDYVFKVQLDVATAEPVTPVASANHGFDFGPPSEPEAPVERPSSLPPQFGVKKRDPFAPDQGAEIAPLDRKNPFELDLRAGSAGSDRQSIGADRFFDDPPAATDPVPDAPSSETQPGDLHRNPFDRASDETRSEPWPPIEITHAPGQKEMGRKVVGKAETARSDTPVDGPQMTAPLQVGTGAMQEALLRGLRLDMDGFTEAEMEAVGARLREMVDGVMFLLRTRSQERQKVRVAQTLIASKDVNPLKFMPDTDAALLALIRGAGDSYLEGDKAVTGAFRDLADHQVRTWSALQMALRRMIDRFDPAEVEREMDETGLLETLVAGGRSAKMWQLYEERYREIAQAAEERFLGEVGADFRDAYETEGGK